MNVRMSKIMRTPIKVGERTYATYASCRSLHCPTPFCCIEVPSLLRYQENYRLIKTDSVRSSVSGLTKDFPVVVIKYVVCAGRELREWSMSSLKLKILLFLPPDSISSCYLQLAVKTIKLLLANAYLIEVF